MIKKLKILMVYPKPSMTSPEKSPALSIFYPGAWAEEEGYSVDYADLRFDNIDDISKRIIDYDILAISSMTGYQLDQAMILSFRSALSSKRIYVIWGGVHGSIVPEQILKDWYADVVIIGEGEKTFVKVLDVLNDDFNLSSLKDVANIAYRINNDIFVNERDDDFLDINKQIYPVTKNNLRYFKASASLGFMRLEESRGCSHNCSYCYNGSFHKCKRREMDINLWRENICRLKKDTDFNYLYFGDNIGKNKDRIILIDNVLKDFNIMAFANMRCDYMDSCMVNILKDSNINSIMFGAESGNNRILKELLNKGYKNGISDIMNCALLMNETDIRTRYTFMTGIPTETDKEIEDSLKLANWLYKADKNSAITFFVFTLYPGSKIYNMCIEKRLLKEIERTKDWLNVERDGGNTPYLNSIYYLSGMAFCDRKGHKTSENFSGFSRLLIKPFELSAKLRFKYRFFKYYDFEKNTIKSLISRMVKRECHRDYNK